MEPAFDVDFGMPNFFSKVLKTLDIRKKTACKLCKAINCCTVHLQKDLFHDQQLSSSDPSSNEEEEILKSTSENFPIKIIHSKFVKKRCTSSRSKLNEFRSLTTPTSTHVNLIIILLYKPWIFYYVNVHQHTLFSYAVNQLFYSWVS